MPKIVSVVSQKGGCGKSTLTMILANYFAYSEKKSVVVIDGDNPQYTIYYRRERDLKQINLSERVLKSHEGTEVGLYNVFRGVADETQVSEAEQIFPITKLIDAFSQQSDIDYIFVDLTGTLNTPSYIDIIRRINYIFVPIGESDAMFDGNYRSLFALKLIVDNSQNNIKGIFEFWTLFREKMSKLLYENLCDKIESFNDATKGGKIRFELMKSKIKDSQMPQSTEMFNTIAPPPKSCVSVKPGGFKISDFITEFKILIGE